jgi:hypothetical protein
LTAGDGTTGDQFGISAAMTALTLVVGATGASSNRGAAYVFENSGGTWSQTGKLTASDASASANFAQSVAISGTTVAAGAMQAGGSGAVYLFDRSGGLWTQTQKLVPSDPVNGAQFGAFVGIDGTRLLTSAIGADGTNGAVYAFALSGGTWSQTQRLTVADAAFGSLGYGLSMAGTNAVFGASSFSGYRGKAYVFKFGGASWSQSYQLVASDVAPDMQYGYPSVISADSTVIGAPGAGSASGAVYVYGIQ